MAKYEESFLNIDPSLSSVEWCDENQPIEVHLSGELDEESVETFESNWRMALMSGQEVIPVVINSTGGDCYCCSKIIDLLDACDKEVITCDAKCMSAAALVFSCGDKRIITPNSSVMLHSVSTGISGGTTAEIRVDSEETDRLNSSMTKILDKNTGNKNYFSKLLRNNLDVYLNAQQCKDCNLATHIGDVKLTTDIVVTSKIEIIRPQKRKRM